MSEAQTNPDEQSWCDEQACRSVKIVGNKWRIDAFLYLDIQTNYLDQGYKERK